MKKYRGFLVMLLVCLLAFCGAALADTLEEDRQALRQAETFDAQLAILNKIAVENAEELQYGGWDREFTVNVAPGLPEGLIPENWDDLQFDEFYNLPEEMRGHKFIALYCPVVSAGPPKVKLAAELLARFPADMRAASLAEAEYALIIRAHMVKSDIEYTPPATSYHRDYEAYAVDLRSGQYSQFWTKRSEAAYYGFQNELNGREFSQRALWQSLRFEILGGGEELLYESEDGYTLVFFRLAGQCIYTTAYNSPDQPAITIPAMVEGDPVTELGDGCFKDNDFIRTVNLPDGLKAIGDAAFENASALESISIPGSVRYIGDKAFAACTQMTTAIIQEGVERLGNLMFLGCERLADLYLPASLLPTDFLERYIDRNMLIYAPEGSFALEWAMDQGYEYVVCNDPGQMPHAEHITIGDFEYYVVGDEAAVSAYHGTETNVIVPDKAGMVPVTSILPNAFLTMEPLESVTLPHSIRIVKDAAFPIQSIRIVKESEPSSVNSVEVFRLYVPNAETEFGDFSVVNYEGKAIILAPEGSLAQRYVEYLNHPDLYFEAWNGT
ncbi:MAG: leucine-rich repeat domain-containing protein [Clostridiales bacterium]|nr:leucine-rich repeat domain-containing protein [Clostridiales bacterium]